MATSNGSLRMSKKGQTRGNGQDRRAKVPRCQHTVVAAVCVASTGSPPPFSPPRSLLEQEFITSHATGKRQTRVVPNRHLTWTPHIGALRYP